MINRQIFASIILLTLLVFVTALEPACASKLPVTRKLPTLAGKLLKNLPGPLGKLIAHTPEIIKAGDKLLHLIATHPVPPPPTNPWTFLLGLLIASYWWEPAEFIPPPEVPHSIKEFYDDAPLFDFDEQ